MPKIIPHLPPRNHGEKAENTPCRRGPGRKVLSACVLAGILQAPASPAGTNNMAGNWSSLTLSGDLSFLSPDWKDFHWLILEQTRLRDDSPDGFRFTENLLFGQLGYAINPHVSIWLGYIHDWIHPLNKPALQENRPYEDLLFKYAFGEFKLTARSRLEQRISQSNGNVGIRVRQWVQGAYPLSFVDDRLSAYVGDEVLVYANQNDFGPTGFSENRAMAGLSYQFTKQFGADLGYLGQYIVVKPGNDIFTHNVQFNLRYAF